ncbi:9243_t:CDS:2, partial [Entrophospora sp. SA101]
QAARKYMEYNLPQKIFISLCIVPLINYKWHWDKIDVWNSLCKKNEPIKFLLQIGVINFNDNYCTKLLPSSMISNIQSQLKNDDVDIIYFDDKKEHGIEKLKVDIDEIVVNYLKNFENCYTLNELRQALNKNNVHAETNTPFNLKYAYQFFNNMYNLYSNDILIRDLSEDELSIYVWSSLINHVFIKIGYNIKFSSGELSSQSFENLKKLAQLRSRSGPKLDSKATMMSVDAEILLHESSKKDVSNKRINDCKKLEYCSKVLLASAFLELPTSSRSDIHKFETYMIQTNGLKLTLSVAGYLFEDTICIFDLTDIVIPKTVEAFPKCIEAVYKILSWK